MRLDTEEEMSARGEGIADHRAARLRSIGEELGSDARSGQGVVVRLFIPVIKVDFDF